MPIRDIPLLAGVVYHVVNRARDGLTLFNSRVAYLAFFDLIAETLERHPIRVLVFCVMSNHWHFLLWPETDEALGGFVSYLSMTHAKRFHRWNGSTGPVYPKRFEARPIAADGNFIRVARYIERNPCAAGLVSNPAAYPWSSAAAGGSLIHLTDWPTPRPRDWKRFVAEPIESVELDQIREHLKRGPQRRLRKPARGFEW